MPKRKNIFKTKKWNDNSDDLHYGLEKCYDILDHEIKWAIEDSNSGLLKSQMPIWTNGLWRIYEYAKNFQNNIMDSVRVERTPTDFQSVASTELAYCPENVFTYRWNDANSSGGARTRITALKGPCLDLLDYGARWAIRDLNPEQLD